MRKLLINGRFLSGDQTAVNVVARELSTALFEHAVQHTNDWKVELVVPHTLVEAAHRLPMPVRSLGRLSGIAWEQLELPRMRNEGVILSLFNTVPLYGRGYITMLHDAHVMNSPESYRPLTRLWREILSRRAGCKGNYLLTPSEYSKSSLLKHRVGLRSEFGIVPNGPGNVGRADPDHGVFDRLKFDPAAPFCVGLSSMLPHKNIKVLFRAFARPELAHINLVLFGKAAREDFVASGHHVPDNVHFSGFVTDEELAALYDRALAVCVPSREEGFGMPALEGMARGAIAVVSTCGALPEVVGDAGLFADPDRPEDISAHIFRIAEDFEYANLLKMRGRARAKTFTWDASAAKAFGYIDAWAGQA